MAGKNYSINKQVKFVNPYNFVRLSKDKSEITNMPDYSETNEKLITGKLHCSLKTKTPLAIPDTESVKKDAINHPTFNFYSVDGEKRIPGSTIRGCIRSTYETLTDSCFVTMAKEMLLTNRVEPSKAYKPGLLIRESGGWVLYEAERLYVRIKGTSRDSSPFEDKITERDNKQVRCIVQNNEEFFFGEAVVVEEKIISNGNGGSIRLVTDMKHMQGNQNGNNFVYVGEPFDNKKYQSVFEKGERLTTNIAQSMNRLQYVLELYEEYKDKGKKKEEQQTIKIEDKHTGYAGYKQAKEKGTIPIWYREEGNVYSLSLASVGRRVYERPVNDMIGEKRNPCQTRTKACPACQLFGMAKEEGIGSKVRITDAKIVNEGKYATRMLMELGSPRTGYVPFYSENGVDFYDPAAMICGRKYYWHIPNAASDKSIYVEQNEENRSERNATVELVEDSIFEFDVYFDRISPAQLEELKWVITLGENRADGNLCHKIGHGKPLGLGSVKMTILEECIRNYDESRNYSIKHVPDTQIIINENVVRFKEDAREQILAICSFDRMKEKKVCYPFIDLGSKDASEFKADDNRIASHQWFTQNKLEKPEIQTLHSVIDKDQDLYAYTFVNGDTSKGKSEKTEEQNFSIGEVFEGTVLKPKKNPKYYFVKLKTEKIVSIWNGDNKFAEGDSIKVKYLGKKKGKDGREYEHWKGL